MVRSIKNKGKKENNIYKYIVLRIQCGMAHTGICISKRILHILFTSFYIFSHLFLCKTPFFY